MKYNLHEIINIIDCTVSGDAENHVVTSLLFDSRSLADVDGTMFCAMATEAADGHQYIPQLYARGVRMFMVENLPANVSQFDGAVFLQVPSVPGAITALADAHRDAMRGRVVAITGSAGKTVVKEMIFQALSRSPRPVKIARSPRSWNSQLGVPLSLLEMDTDADIAIVEAGIDSPGEMDNLAALIRPDIAVLTSVTSEHDAGFKSRVQKIEEKLHLLYPAPLRIVNVADADVRAAADSILGNYLPVDCAQASHQITDFVLAYTVLAQLGFPRAEIGAMTEAGLKSVSNRIDVHEGVNDCVMLYDGFTNDVRSLKASLDFMRRRATSTRTNTLITADIPAGTEADYTALGRLLRQFGINRVIAAGKDFATHAALLGPSVAVESVDTLDRLLADYDINRFSSETILIAGGPDIAFKTLKNTLEAPRHDTIYEINLDALVHNFNYYRSLLRPETGLVAMVKASAYGTGALEVAKTMQAQGAAYLAVAVADEGVELRRGGITMPVMVLNPVTTNYRALFRDHLEPSVFSLRELDTLITEARRSGVTSFNAHIKLDTGMHRVGFTEAEIPALLQALENAPELHVASIFSHLATADCPDQGEYTQMQLDTFDRLSGQITAALPYSVKRHILNTAGIMTHPGHQYDLVRLGIGLYGINPIDSAADLRTVATLKSTIYSIKTWEACTTVGYGRRGVLNRRSVIATVPIGYADGVDRHLGCGAASFVVRGHECPTVGNICMDQCMIDITDVPDAAIGDDVEIFGTHMAVERIAATLGTIPYEPLCTVSPRVKRIYYRE